MRNFAPNPEMIVLARQSRGVLGNELADKVGVSKGLVSKVERGAADPADDLLSRIANALGYPMSLFYRPEHVRGTDSICFHHRKKASMPVKVLVTTESQMYLTQLQVRRLLEDLEIESANEFVTLDPDDYDGDPRAVARALRRLWHLPNGPIGNLVRVIEAAGGVVVLRDFGTSKLDGMSCWPKACPPLFFLNSEMPVDRMRWTLAHELGHLVMHSLPPSRNPEVEANEFAQEFLAPVAEIMPDLRNLRFSNLAALKAHWRMSMNALTMTAKTVGALSEPRIRSLYVQLSRAGYRTAEPFPLSPEEPTIIQDAIRLHREELDYSVDELARVTDLLPAEFRDLYIGPEEPQRLLRIV